MFFLHKVNVWVELCCPSQKQTFDGSCSCCWRPEVAAGERVSLGSVREGGDDVVIASGKNSIVYSAVPFAGTWEGRERK